MCEILLLLFVGFQSNRPRGVSPQISTLSCRSGLNQSFDGPSKRRRLASISVSLTNRIFSRLYRPGEPQVSRRPSLSSYNDAWPAASLNAEQRFAQPHAKLFPFIGRKVRTPSGVGTLIQVFAKRVTVLLDSELGRCSFFPPAIIQPVSWDL
jgi:hypothetical protein